MRASVLFFALAFSVGANASEPLPANRWTEVARDPAGARPGSALRYVPDTHAFYLWGFMNDDPELLQEQPLIRIPEYDMVRFDPEARTWKSDLPPAWAEEWSKRLPLAYVPRTYAGITNGSERTVVRSSTNEPEAAPRPDLNVVFDQVVYVPSMHALLYFTGGSTAAYDVVQRRWTDLSPRHSPPPVMGGSLAYDPVHDEVVLFGGGHVAEQTSDGRPAGYTGTWAYDLRANDWHQLETKIQPPPRMNTRMVTDTRTQALILFGGDGQSHYLADTWIFDLKARTWRRSRAPGPEPRAGHFTVYDPDTGWVIIGGGYNRRDLTDMWAYDAREDRWRRLAGDVPTGFHLTADIAPDTHQIALSTSTRTPGDRMTCNILFPVRTTYMYRIDPQQIVIAGEPSAQQGMAKRPPQSQPDGAPIDWDRLPKNRWVLLDRPGRSAPTRTWGSATFDVHRDRILYWGGGHCGYGGSDIDMFDVARNTWRSSDESPEYPERLWNHGVREAGITFGGRPWMEHGRRIYAYDPVSRRMIVVRRLRLTAGYDPPLVRDAPAGDPAAPDALVRAQSSYVKFVTWVFDPASSKWELAGRAPVGVDTLVSTPQGVVGIDVDWPSRLNDAGYQRRWTAGVDDRPAAVYLYDAAAHSWKRLDHDNAESPQNLYELTTLAYDSRRNQLILHGGGPKRDELWTFDMQSGRWRNMHPESNGTPPTCSREGVYLPQQDVFLTVGDGAWIWKPAQNTWQSVRIPFDVTPRTTGQNRAMVYDPRRDVVFLVIGAGGDDGLAQVYALRYAENE